MAPAQPSIIGSYDNKPQGITPLGLFFCASRRAQPIALAQPYDCGIDCGIALRDCGNSLREFIAGKQFAAMSGGYKWRYYNIGTYAFEHMVGRSLKPTLYSISSGPNPLR